MLVTNPFSDLRSWTRAQVEAVSRGWWVLLASGVVSVVAGGIIVTTAWTVGDLAVFIGAALVFRGLFTLFSIPIDGSARAWSGVAGVLEICVGVAVWAWPGPTVLVIAFFIGWWLLFRGIMTISGSIATRGFLPYWGWVLALGAVESLVAFYLLSRPAVTLVATILAVGLTALLYGVAEIAVAVEVKRLPERFYASRPVVDGGDPRTRPRQSTLA